MNGADNWNQPLSPVNLNYVLYYDPAQPDKIGYKALGQQRENQGITKPSGCDTNRAPDITDVSIVWEPMSLSTQTSMAGETIGQYISVDYIGKNYRASDGYAGHTMYGGCTGKQCKYVIQNLDFMDEFSPPTVFGTKTVTFTLP